MAEPRPSSTVVVARDTAQGPQFLLVRRRAGDAFGESYTFPGGVLDPDESDARRFCAGLAPGHADKLLGTENALDYFSAVARELFEETGILLGAPSQATDEQRQQLHDGTLSWPDLLRQEQLRVPCDALHYFAHWITPVGLPKRWSTRFFLARMPESQAASPDGSEVTDCCWLTAVEALSGEGKLPFPTRTTIEWIRTPDTVDALIELVGQRQASGIPAIQPEVRSEDGRPRIFMPDIAD